MESLDELRDEIKILADNHIDTDELVRIADAIEQEVKERYIERPVDADGMAIAPSDNMVDRNGEQFVVSSIELLASGEWLVYRNGKLGNEFATRCRHHKPPTLRSCPFCGSNDLYIVEHMIGRDAPFMSVDDKTVGIFCNTCKQTVTLEANEDEGRDFSTEQRAIAAWNRRTQ